MEKEDLNEKQSSFSASDGALHDFQTVAPKQNKKKR